MMGNKAKRKGSQWERDACSILEELIPSSSWKRIAGSGAIGTIMNEPLLSADVVGKIEGIPRPFRAEAKVGYGGAKQLTVKREWFEKIKEEAEGTWAIPLLLCKFSGARGDSKHFVAMDFEAFALLIGLVSKIYESEQELLKRLE